MQEMKEEDNIYLLIESFIQIIENDKKIIGKWGKACNELRGLFTEEELTAIRDIICIDLDRAKKRVKQLEEQVCQGDADLRALFGLEDK